MIHRETIEIWVLASERLPEDGVPVQVELANSGEVRLASRGHYQSTGAWFDEETHVPIYESITQWRPRH